LDDPKPEEDGTVDPDPAKALEADMKASKK
jgi:hypothetical protein